MTNTELGISIGRIVIYTDNKGHQHAAIVSRPVHPDRDGINLVVFDYEGTPGYTMFSTYGEGKGQWQWPPRVPPVDRGPVSATTPGTPS